MGDSADGAAIHVPKELTLRSAPAYVRAVERHLAAGTTDLLVDLEDVKTVDVIGLAVLLQSIERCRQRGIPVGVVPGAAVYGALVDAGIAEHVPVAGERRALVRSHDVLSWSEEGNGRRPYVARTRDFGLRPPGWDDMPLFVEWARSALLEQMVGSELLYRCRHLGPYHPSVLNEALNHPTSLTLLLDSFHSTSGPLGFMRVFGIRLVQGFGFFEVAVASREALRKGWGVAASYLMLAYVRDVLKLRRIEAKVYEYNRLSINSLRRNGFRQEGVLRKAVVAEGGHWDILIFSLLKEEMATHPLRDEFPSMSLWADEAPAEPAPVAPPPEAQRAATHA